MTPGARVAAAIGLLDEIQSGAPAEQALTRWGRQNRYAGSKDRAAVRDHVFDALRRKRSSAAVGGGETGRQIMAGLLAQSGAALEALFSGEGHAPSVLGEDERPDTSAEMSQGQAWDLPDWIVPEFSRSLGDLTEDTAFHLRNRAPVTLRVNFARGDRAQAKDSLAADGVVAVENPLADSALTVAEGNRKIRQSDAYATGLVELQDAASQAVVALVPPGGRVLDYCAGGGGKALALAMDPQREVYAHDAIHGRMKDLPFRAERAKSTVTIIKPDEIAGAAPFDVILCDVPCSGSGAWRRNPDGKWALTQEQLTQTMGVQNDILAQVADFVAQNGTIVYATCSVLRCENEDRVADFLANHPGWSCRLEQRYAVTADGDGFYTAHLTRVH